MEGRWQSQNSVHVCQLPLGLFSWQWLWWEMLVRCACFIIITETGRGNISRGLAIHTKGLYGACVNTLCTEEQRGLGAQEFHCRLWIRSWKGYRNAKCEDFLQKVTQRTQPGVPRKAAPPLTYKGGTASKGFCFPGCSMWSEVGKRLGVSGWNLLLPGGAESLRPFFLLHLIIQEHNRVILVPRDLPTTYHQVEDSLESLESFWL